MAKIPVRFKRVAAAFDEISRARICSESSGSEHSPDTDDSTDLSDLIESFIERDGEVVEGEEDNEVLKKRNDSDSEKFLSDSETKDMLQSLLGGGDGERKKLRKIRSEIELACRVIGSNSSLSSASTEGFKRELMTRLRERGFDAGLCKSRWEKTGRFPAGTFEYIDIVVTGTRYIMEVNLAGEFTIARPTTRYLSLLEVFPKIFIGKSDKLKQIVRLMCAAAKESMKSSDMHVAPWRSNGFMQAKWLSSYKRTTNPVTAKIVSDSDAGKRSVGFETSPAILYNCRSEFTGKVMMRAGGLKIGKLAQVFNGIES